MFTDVRPICLPDPGKDYNNVTALVTGWGKNKFRGNQSQIQASVTTSHCKKSDYPEHNITENMICAQGAGTDACNEDSGGPLAVRGPDGSYSQIGVASWGGGCVYTNLTANLPWLTETMKTVDPLPSNLFCMKYEATCGKKPGSWGSWRSWSKCSQTCGGGTEERLRNCDSPAPSHGGEYCHGKPVEVRSCNKNQCKWKYYLNPSFQISFQSAKNFNHLHNCICLTL